MIEYNKWSNTRAPCQEHVYYNARYRFEIYPMELVDIPVSFCDHCGSVFITERGWKGTIDGIQQIVEKIVRKEKSKIHPLCHLKRRIKWTFKKLTGTTNPIQIQNDY